MGIDSKSMMRNVFSNWTALFLNVSIGFFMAPYMVHSLGDSMYGLWVLILSLTGYMGLLDSGLKTSIVRFVAKYNATSDKDSINEIATTSIVLYSLLSLIVVVITVSLAVEFESIFNVSTDEKAVVRTVVCLGGVGLMIGLPMGVFGGLVVGLQRYDLLNKANIIVLGLRTVGIVVLLFYGFKVVAVSSMQVLSQFILGGLLVWYAYRQYPSLSFRWSYFKKETIKVLYGYSSFIFLNNLAMFFLFYSGEIIVGMFLDMSTITYYAIATSLLHYLSKFVGSMTQVLHPYASDQHARGNQDKILSSVLIGTRISLLIVLPVALGYIIVGKAFISLWMGHSYAEVAGPILAISAVGRIAWLSHSSAGNVFLGIGKHKVITSANVATGLLGIIFSVVLVRDYGLSGVAIGLTCSLLISQVFMIWYILKVFKVSLAEYLKQSYLGPCLASIPFAGVLMLTAAFATANHLLMFILSVSLALAVYVFSAYFSCFSTNEREAYFLRYVRQVPWIKAVMKGA